MYNRVDITLQLKVVMNIVLVSVNNLHVLVMVKLNLFVWRRMRGRGNVIVIIIERSGIVIIVKVTSN